MRTPADIKKLFASCLLGCKWRRCLDHSTVADHILAAVPDWVRKVFVPFCGTCFDALVLKHSGREIVANDIRREAYVRARGLLAGSGRPLSGEEILSLAEPGDPARNPFRLHYGGILGWRNADFFGWIRENLAGIAGTDAWYTAALGLLWVFEKRVSQNTHLHVMPHRMELSGGRHTRNNDLAADWLDFQMRVYPSLVHDNGARNPCFNEDAVPLAPRIMADGLLADSPYAGGWASYGHSYALTEKFVQILEGQPPPDPFLGGDLQPHASFSSRLGALDGLSKLMWNSRHIPFWLICWSDCDRMKVASEEVALLAQANGRVVEIRRVPVRTTATKQGDLRQHNECLIVCTPKGGRS